jgi:hypothetical protein
MVHFSSILSGHLALVARNDPLVSTAPLGDSPDKDCFQTPDTPILLQFEQPPAKAGLLVTGELRAGIARVKKNVAAIAQACRRRNSKFRHVVERLSLHHQPLLIVVPGSLAISNLTLKKTERSVYTAWILSKLIDLTPRMCNESHKFFGNQRSSSTDPLQQM